MLAKFCGRRSGASACAKNKSGCEIRMEISCRGRKRIRRSTFQKGRGEEEREGAVLPLRFLRIEILNSRRDIESKARDDKLLLTHIFVRGVSWRKTNGYGRSNNNGQVARRLHLFRPFLFTMYRGAKSRYCPWLSSRKITGRNVLVCRYNRCRARAYWHFACSQNASSICSFCFAHVISSRNRSSATDYAYS